MNLLKIYREEDFFPREFTVFVEREYGLLFYNDNNKDSDDSNHVIIFKDKINDITKTLEDITEFYRNKRIKPTIYQSITDDGYFESIREEFCFLWPDGESVERIYYEAGFRLVEVKTAGRACYLKLTI